MSFFYVKINSIQSSKNLRCDANIAGYRESVTKLLHRTTSLFYTLQK